MTSRGEPPVGWTGVGRMVALAGLWVTLAGSPAMGQASPPSAPPAPSAGLVRVPERNAASLHADAEAAARVLLNASATVRPDVSRVLRLESAATVVERLAVQPVTGPSAITTTGIVPRAPSASVNWLGLGGGAVAAHPGVALLLAQLDGTGEFSTQCTGTLIRPDIVLTASHCVCHPVAVYWKTDICTQGTADIAASKLIDPDKWRVFFQHAGLYQVSQVVVNPQFTFGADGVHADLALLVLSKPVPWIRSPTLATQGQPPAWAEAIASGFGYSANPNAPAATALQLLVRPGLKSQGRVFPADCSALRYLAADEVVCASFTQDAAGSQATICAGDSGGPLWVGGASETIYLGVTSGRDDENCAAQGTYGFQMRIAFSDYAAWIQDRLKAIPQPSPQPNARWPAFGDNLRNVLDRRNAAIFSDGGVYISEGWIKADDDEVVLMTLNSPGRVTRAALEDQSTKQPACAGLAAEQAQVPNVDYCFATVKKGAKFRVVANGSPGERLQFVVSTFPVGTSFDAP